MTTTVLSQRHKFLIGVGIISIAVFVVFLPCLRGGFITLDDYEVFLNNPAVSNLSLQSISQIFAQNIHKVYLPLTTLSFALEHHFFGFNPFIIHLDNMLLHIGNVVLVAFLALRLGLPATAALLAALVFGVHPMRAESVAWASERKDVLYVFFYLLALHQYWSYLTTNSRKFYIATLVLGILSLLAKPMALSLPMVLLLLDWFKGRRFDSTCWLEKIPFFLYVFLLGTISYILNKGAFVDASQAVLIWLWSFGFYLWKFAVPCKVYAYYELPQPVSITHWPYFASVLLFVSVLGLLFWARKNRWLVFAFGYWFLSIFFLLRFEFESGFSVVSDRYMYLPSLGFCLLFGVMYQRWAGNKLIMLLFTVIVVLFGLKTQQQCFIWQDSLTFYNDIVQNYPKTSLGYSRRGYVYYTLEQYGQAAADYSKAIKLEPKSFIFYDFRGECYMAMGAKDKALGDFRKSIELSLLDEIDRCSSKPDRRSVSSTLEIETALNKLSKTMPALTPESAQTAAGYLADAASFMDEQDFEQALKSTVQAQKMGIAVEPCFLQRLRQATSFL